MTQFLFSFLMLSFVCFSGLAQTVVSGSVADKQGEALPGCTVLFLQADTVAGGVATDNKGRFQLKGLDAGDYECRVSMIGYKPASLKFRLNEKAKLPQFLLEQDSKALDEVTVSVDARELTKELAGMSIYYLTNSAKDKSNIYDALTEIPRLIINPLNRSIALDDPRSPLILVNGVKKPINAIDPKTIESVEIIDNPSARYRGNADVSAVLNIKTKKDGIQPYLTTYAGVIMTPNVNDLFSWGTVETGSETSSLNIDGGYVKTDKMKTESYSDITQGDIHRVEYGEGNGYRKHWEIKISGDKEFSKKNYFAYNIDYVSTTSANNASGHGSATQIKHEETSNLKSEYWSKTPFKNLAGGLFYKHSFTDDRTIELEGRYNYSKNSSDGWREESSDIYSFVNDISLYNLRHSGGLDINYSDMLSESIHLDAGANTAHSSTDIDDLSDNFPMFRYRRTQEYVYAGIDNNVSNSKFNYVVSLGLDMVFNDADKVKHSYLDVLPSVSLSYKVAKKQTISLSYNRSRYIPATHYLNPRNTSTDSLI